MIPADPNSLTRAEIKAALKRHPGSKTALAAELGIHKQNITNWLANRNNSKRVDTAVRQRAAELINAEREAAEKQ